MTANPLRLTDIRLRRETLPLSEFKVTDRDDRGRAMLMSVSGVVMEPDARFFQSCFSRFGISNSAFKYFSHQEVFDRIQQVLTDDDKSPEFQVTIDETNPRPVLLSISHPDRDLPALDSIASVLGDNGIDLNSFAADFGEQNADRLVIPTSGFGAAPTQMQTGLSNGSNLIQKMAGRNILAEGAFSHASQLDFGAKLAALPQVSYSRGIIRVLADRRSTPTSRSRATCSTASTPWTSPLMASARPPSTWRCCGWCA
jgi:hypothetical protein